MNTRKQALIPGMIAALAMPGAYAADSHRCNQQFDDAQRLACYDATFGKPVRPASAPVAPATPTAPAATAVVVVPAAAPVVAPAAAVAPPPAAPAKVATPDPSGSSVITSLGRRANGRFVATLENGTVWSQLEPDATLMVKVGDAVTIRKGVFGSFMLVTQNGASTRVEIVK